MKRESQRERWTRGATRGVIVIDAIYKLSLLVVFDLFQVELKT